MRVDPAEAAVIRELFARHDEPSASLFALARHLQSLGALTPHGQSRWNPATIRGLLRNPVYTGQVYAGRFRSGAPQARYSATRPIGRPTSPAGEHTRFCHLRKDYIDDRGQPIRGVQGGDFAGQQDVARGAQHGGQVAEQSLGGGVVLALAVAARQRRIRNSAT